MWPPLWGYLFWFVRHCITFSLRNDDLTPQQRTDAIDFMKLLCTVLPCPSCKQHCVGNSDPKQDFESGAHLWEFDVRFHNIVNYQTKKRQFELDEAVDAMEENLKQHGFSTWDDAFFDEFWDILIFVINSRGPVVEMKPYEGDEKMGSPNEMYEVLIRRYLDSFPMENDAMEKAYESRTLIYDAIKRTRDVDHETVDRVRDDLLALLRGKYQVSDEYFGVLWDTVYHRSNMASRTLNTYPAFSINDRSLRAFLKSYIGLLPFGRKQISDDTTIADMLHKELAECDLTQKHTAIDAVARLHNSVCSYFGHGFIDVKGLQDRYVRYIKANPEISRSNQMRLEDAKRHETMDRIVVTDDSTLVMWMTISIVLALVMSLLVLGVAFVYFVQRRRITTVALDTSSRRSFSRDIVSQ